MKIRPNLVALAVAGLCLTGFYSPVRQALLSTAQAAEAPAEEPQWLMTVNGQTVSTREFTIYFTERVRQSHGQPTNQLQSQAVNELINFILVAEDARQKGLDKQPEVQAAIKLQQDQLLSRVALQEYANSYEPSEADIKKAYDESNATRSDTEYKARHILVTSEDEAKALIKQLDGGTDFVKLASEHSTGPTGSDGGDLGWFDPSQMVEPFSKAIQAMKPKTYSKEPVKTDFGWHVILLEETRAAKPPTLDEMKPELTNALKQKALAEYLSGLREKAKVEFNPALTAKPADAAPPAEEKKAKPAK